MARRYKRCDGACLSARVLIAQLLIVAYSCAGCAEGEPAEALFDVCPARSQTTPPPAKKNKASEAMYAPLLVELAMPSLFLFCGLRTGPSVTTFLNAFYVTSLVTILVTDIEHRLILHAVTLPSILVAFAGAYLNPAFDNPKRALLGGAIGLLAALSLYLFGALFSWLLGRLRGEELPGPALGFGDVTLSAFLGLIVGVPEIIFALVIGMLAGFVGAVVFLLVRGGIQRAHRAFASFIPYGPFLVLGGAAMLFFGTEFMAWYTGG